MTTVLRTPEARFHQLPDFPWEPRYLVVQDARLGPLRMHYIDEGPQDAPVVLLLHGEPSWCYLYRHVMRGLLDRGLRCVAPDLIGFGRSDKPANRADYSYRAHVDWVSALVAALDLQRIVLVGQDWGGPIGLSVLAGMPERFAAVVAANTLLPNCQPPPLGVAGWPGPIIEQWVEATRDARDLPVSDIVAGVCMQPLSAAVRAAYDAPFPEPAFKAGPLVFPSLIPREEGMPGVKENREVWAFLEQWRQPFVTAFSDGDPATADWAEVFQARIPGARGRSHPVLRGAGHFLQEEQGPALAAVIGDLAGEIQGLKGRSQPG